MGVAVPAASQADYTYMFSLSAYKIHNAGIAVPATSQSGYIYVFSLFRLSKS